MKTLIFGIILSVMTTNAWASDPSCASQSADKHLAGAAKASFMKKCTADATTSCSASATSNHLAGAAKNSFVKKCVADATG